MIEFQEIINMVEEVINKGEYEEINDLTKDIEKLNSNGVYIIKKRLGEVIYIGSAPKQTLNERLLKGHLEGKNTALTRKAPKLYGEERYSKKDYAKLSSEKKKEIGEYLKNNCLFLVKSIDDFDKVLAVESLLILYFRDKVPELLNDYKK